jgi:hypothetical protein
LIERALRSSSYSVVTQYQVPLNERARPAGVLGFESEDEVQRIGDLRVNDRTGRHWLDACSANATSSWP